MDHDHELNEWARTTLRAMLKRISLELLKESVSMTAAAERIWGRRQ